MSLSSFRIRVLLFNESDEELQKIRRQIKSGELPEKEGKDRLFVLKDRKGLINRDKADRSYDRIYNRKKTLNFLPQPEDDVFKELKKAHMRGNYNNNKARTIKARLEKNYPDLETRPDNIRSAIELLNKSKDHWKDARIHINKAKASYFSGEPNLIDPLGFPASHGHMEKFNDSAAKSYQAFNQALDSI